MAKSKKPNVKDLKAYFFLSIGNGDVHTIYDDYDNEALLAAAFASAMMEDTNLFNIISAAFITLLEEKEKYNSKKSNKLPKTVKKSSKQKYISNNMQ